MSDVQESQPTQITLSDLLAASPPDDVGAETQARFRFQAEVIARDVIGVLTGEVRAVICEWQEDAIVLHADGSAELVSVKHREPSEGTWTPNRLVSDGLKHLHRRWSDTGKRARCRLSTNGGLNADAQRLKNACAAENDPSLGAFASSLSPGIDAAAPQVLEFLRVLRLEDGLPHRSHIDAVTIARMMRPALRRLGLERHDAEAVHTALVDAVEAASRDRTGGSHEFLEFIADPRRLDAAKQRERRLAARTLDREAVRRAVAESAPDRRVRLVPGTTTPSTVLQQKLVAGGFGETAIANAQRLRASWTVFEAAYVDPLGPSKDEFEDLATRVGREAMAAEVEAMRRASGAPYGLDMYQLLVDRLTANEVAPGPIVPNDPGLLEAFVFELTDRCAIWWSPPFTLAT